MNPLHLSGYGVKIKVRNLRSCSELELTDGKEWVKGWGKIPRTFKFRPRRIPYSSIIVDGHSGHITLQALHWLSRSKIPVFVLDHWAYKIEDIEEEELRLIVEQCLKFVKEIFGKT